MFLVYRVRAIVCYPTIVTSMYVLQCDSPSTFKCIHSQLIFDAVFAALEFGQIFLTKSAPA